LSSRDAAFAAGSSSTLVSPIQKSNLISYLYNLVLPNKKCVKSLEPLVAIEKSDYFAKYTYDFLLHCRISEFLHQLCGWAIYNPAKIAQSGQTRLLGSLRSKRRRAWE
jgi:hypothetical protein